MRQIVRRARLQAAAAAPLVAARCEVWRAASASGCIPEPKTCLNRALSAKVLLARHGLSTHVCIGARRDPSQLAHAVEVADGVLVGKIPGSSRCPPQQLENAEP